MEILCGVGEETMATTTDTGMADRLLSESNITGMVDRFRKSAALLEKTMEKLSTMKPEDSQPFVTEAALLILDLKTSSRSINLNVDQFRQHVHDYKNKLDNSQQQLQNLLYRKQHLVKQLTLCHDFTIHEVEKVEKDENVLIVTNGESNQDLSSNEPHQKRLKLLSDELTSRSELESELLELSNKRKFLEESIDDNKTFLTGLPEQLRSIQGASQVLQRHFKLPGSEVREYETRAADLSEPLYVLFRQLDSLCNVENKMKVSIEDSETFKKKVSSSTNQRKGSSEVDAVFSVEDHAIILSLEVDIDAEETVMVKLRFQRLVQCNTITVECESNFENHAFMNLFPGDSGDNFPSSSQSLVEYPKESPSRAYVWCQWLGGLNSLPESNKTNQLSASSRMILQRLNLRVKAYTILKKQLLSLSDKTSVTIHPSCEALFPDVNKSNYPALIKWQAVENTAHNTAVASFNNKSDISMSNNDMFFTATFKTKKGTQEAHVMITSSYPEVAPRWILNSGTFDQDMKDIEVELNAHYDELVSEVTDSWNWLLSHQITRLQMCLGSLDELKSLSFHGHESRSRRGRNRRRPLAYNASEAQFFHR